MKASDIFISVFNNAYERVPLDDFRAEEYDSDIIMGIQIEHPSGDRITIRKDYDYPDRLVVSCDSSTLAVRSTGGVNSISIEISRD